MNKSKDLGQVFTPQWVVDLMLDQAGYSGPAVLTTRALEPSCGEGVFLLEMVKRLVNQCRAQELADADIVTLLEQNLHAVEYDPDVLAVALANLNTLAAHLELPLVKWHLVESDALLYKADGEYDLVVGNPPYIRLHNMTPDMREHVKQFSMAHGTTDLYVIFYELGLQWLAPNGQLIYIAPNSWLKNASQREFRRMLIEQRLIQRITNFGARKVFGKDASTYTAVVQLCKEPASDLIYQEDTGVASWIASTPYAAYRNYAGTPLHFFDTADVKFIQQRAKLPRTFESVATVQNGVATLRDKVFLSAPTTLEADMLAPVVKASTYRGQPVDSKILLPYRAKGARLVPLTEAEFSQYPVAYAYASQHRAELEKRDRDKSATWFHFGRSQGLATMHQQKLVFSHVIAPGQKIMEAHLVDAAVIVYSGLYVTVNDSKVPLAELKKIIESPEFCRYMILTGKDLSGGYKTIGSKNVKAYPIT